MPYIIPNTLLFQASQLGVHADGGGEELRQVISRMIRQSAPVTHPNGNRRYEEWVFNIEKSKLTGEKVVSRIHLIECETCDDRKRVDVYDVCAHCDGEGCKWCHDKGEFRNMIPCPECASK